MKIVGLIAEYNPFHNGHKYHIEKAKELSKADAVVVVMSGNFVQRGAPAIMPKHLRAKMALLSGADLCIELPVPFATGTAEHFAYGSIALLHRLGCIDAICFGSECGDIHMLKSCAEILCEEPEAYRLPLQEFLRQGNSFPLAREKALYQATGDKYLSDLLKSPNNILGIEYLKALYRLGSSIEPITITRKEAGYHDDTLGSVISSATAIREYVSTHSDLSALSNQMPQRCYAELSHQAEKRFPIYADDFSLLLKYRLLSENAASLTQYQDVSESLANKIINNRNRFVTCEQFCELLKTKELTYTRIGRALFHILLGIKKEPALKEPAYARILGFRTEAASVLTEINACSSIPLISKLADARPGSDDAKLMLETDRFAADLYESVITEKYHTTFINEYEQPIVRV